jgi:hypothetical protein
MKIKIFFVYVSKFISGPQIFSNCYFSLMENLILYEIPLLFTRQFNEATAILTNQATSKPASTFIPTSRQKQAGNHVLVHSVLAPSHRPPLTSSTIGIRSL